jgi:hypothetical protein
MTPTQTTQTGQSGAGLQFPQFYQPNPNSPQVFDAQGNAVDLQQYKTATQQTDVPDDKVNFGYVQPTMPGAANSNAPFDPTAYGISQDVWSSLSPTDQAFVQATAGVVSAQYNQGATNVSINQDLLNKALTAAQTDPTILATYGDAAKQGMQQLQFNLGQISSNWDTSQAVQNQNIELQKKALSDQYAAAGTAYSGFRQQAKEQLATSQADVIQSSRSQLQQNLQSLGSQYESQFGSAATPALKVNGVGQNPGAQYTPVGGITGTQPLSQQQAVLQKQSSIYAQEANPSTQ